MTVLDASDIVAPGGVVNAAMLRPDNIHLSAMAALRVAQEKFVPIIQNFYAAGSGFNQDVTVNNLLSASVVNMDGTTGTKTGTPNTGNVPTGWNVTRGRNCAIDNSIDDYETGKHRLNMAVTPGGTDNGDYFEISVTPPTAAIAKGEPNKWYQAWFKVEVDNAQDLTFIEAVMGLYIGTGTAVHRSSGLSRAELRRLRKGPPAGPLSIWLTAPAVYNQSGNTPDRRLPRGFLRFTGKKTGAPLTIKISRPIYRQVPDPRDAYEGRVPLPDLPLAAGAKIMGLGHSFIGLGAASDLQRRTDTRRKVIQGFYENGRTVLSWIKAADGRFNIDMFAELNHPFFAPGSFAAFSGAMAGKSGIVSTPYPAWKRNSLARWHAPIMR